ncbi:MAG: hypothetical protein ABFC89_10155 [Methanospirillum sp.]
MDPVVNATMPLVTHMATVPPLPADGPVVIAHTFDTFGFIVALLSLAIPMVFYLVWIAVGVAALVYLRRQLRGP